MVTRAFFTYTNRGFKPQTPLHPLELPLKTIREDRKGAPTCLQGHGKPAEILKGR